jgi:hypothetical protein
MDYKRAKISISTSLTNPALGLNQSCLPLLPVMMLCSYESAPLLLDAGSLFTDRADHDHLTLRNTHTERGTTVFSRDYSSAQTTTKVL